MARPLKSGVDYFSLDTDFFYNRKVKLIRSEFGMQGVAVALAIISEIYRTEGYFMKWSTEDCLLMSQGAAGGCAPGFIQEVLLGCIRCSLFNKRVFDMFGVITSAEIQRRYLSMVRKRSVVPIYSEYWLRNTHDENDVQPNVLDKLAFKSVSDGETPVFGAETPVFGAESTQRKSKRKSKSKSNQIKEERTGSRHGNRDDDYDDEITAQLISRVSDAVVGRRLNDREKNTVHELIGRHGPERVRAGIDAAINAGGRSVNYVSKCVETVPSASGRYDPTYDIAEIEALLDAEWHEEEEDT